MHLISPCIPGAAERQQKSAATAGRGQPVLPPARLVGGRRPQLAGCPAPPSHRCSTNAAANCRASSGCSRHAWA